MPDLTLEQITAPTPRQPEKLPLVIPVLWAALQPDGRPGQERLLVLDQQRQTLVVEGLPPAAKPLFSRCSVFSAPVTWDAGQSTDDLFALFAGDDDAFARWDAGQQLWKQLMLAQLPARLRWSWSRACWRRSVSCCLSRGRRIRLCWPRCWRSLDRRSWKRSDRSGSSGPGTRCRELREQLGSQLASLLQTRLDAVASGLEQVWPAGQGERQLTG